ncbi:sulfite exporter TauE/SafE family protein [Maridesulfovibrio bastinii]|uniref:sulfite exporter TauE/SafE family protein n=1 Tax=Maridesulfovibrio bastinii TaxID=47157 RepID=UPI00042503CF|nr:sulfite exporter TauE/SafE family protein [Maridesulfovibrio bastinii]
MFTILLTFIILGAVAGILAGLLGIGGGLVIVPILVFSFTPLGFPQEHLMHMALGTSMASIIFTSISSSMAHHKRGAVRWSIFKSITPGIIVGTFLGTCLASVMNTTLLKSIFVIFLYYVASQMLLNIKPKPTRTMPGTVGMFGSGGVIGAVSSLVGIGGGTLCVPFMTFCNIEMHTAVGTAAAIGLPIALAGTAGYIWNGIGVAGVPDWSIGYVYLPALIGIVAASMFTAPFGVKLSHSLPVSKLKKVFAVLLIVVATRMLISMF